MKELSQEDIQVLFADFQKKEEGFIETSAEMVRKLIRNNLPKLRAAALLNQDLQATFTFHIAFDFSPAKTQVEANTVINMGCVTDSDSARIVANRK